MKSNNIRYSLDLKYNVTKMINIRSCNILRGTRNLSFLTFHILVFILSRPACGNIALLTVESKSINAQHLHESCYQPNVKFNYSYLFSIILN